MKRIIRFLFSLFLVFTLCPVNASAEEYDLSKFEFTAPEAPNYFIYTDGEASEGQHDDLRMIMVADPEVAMLSAEYYNDSDTFYKKYGLYSFNIAMQYDVSLDGEDNWQYTSEWDENYYNNGHVEGYPYVTISGSMMEDFEFFWLTYHEGPDSSTFKPYQSAILTEKFVTENYEENIYSFDIENHSLYIRCRYYMDWETYDGENIGEKQSKFSDWSESAVFGKNSTQIIPETPTSYEAPVISDLKIILPGEYDSNSHLEYTQTTPESVWMTNIYYMMTGDGQFDGLETEVSINDGEWITFDTADSWGDWSISNTVRGAFNDDVPIEEDSHVKLRIRFTGTHGPSEWSNILDVNGGGTQEVPEIKNPAKEEPPAEMLETPVEDIVTEEKCSLCGFCAVPLGLCIIIWIIIAIVLILVVVILIIVATRKRKCPNCKTKYNKKDKWCQNCGHPLK